ncbi:hypothetical protein RI129_011996 [Pyrocoelia pectoralis]|uniref:AH domain-containing protein n=1 Tax=Pyrocoelia pectoralis TaxID=417401 RepID=A0AAN7V3U5_9COLE
MSQLKSSASERTSIHDMLKDTPPNENRSSNVVAAVETKPACPYSRSVPTGLSACTSSPAILTPTAPTQNDDATIMKTSSRIENLKNWSISTYKCTKQLMFEKLGKSSRTVDTAIKGTQRKYSNILRLSRALTSHFYHVVQTQHALGEAFSELAQKSPELQEEFLYNSETQRNLTKMERLFWVLLTFHVVHTLQSVRQYEAARIEYDAYRTDLESLMPKADGTVDFDEAQKSFETHRQNFMKLRTEVTIKMKFLDENRIKVMHKQLLLFHNAISAYFSGNQVALEATLKQFNIKVKTPNSAFPSWLEQ